MRPDLWRVLKTRLDTTVSKLFIATIKKEKPMKKIKKLTIEITDEALLAQHYPDLVTEETIVRKVVDKPRLRKLCNAMVAAGGAVPGVRAYYASDEVSGGEE